MIGNTLMVMALASRRIGAGEMLRAWVIVYVGNLIGAVGTALLVFLAGQYLYNGGNVGAVALGIARAKAELPFAATSGRPGVPLALDVASKRSEPGLPFL